MGELASEPRPEGSEDGVDTHVQARCRAGLCQVLSLPEEDPGDTGLGSRGFTGKAGSCRVARRRTVWDSDRRRDLFLRPEDAGARKASCVSMGERGHPRERSGLGAHLESRALSRF